MRQTTLCEGRFAQHAKQTKREKFLLRMEQIIPWDELSKAIERRYPKPEGSGRRAVGVERMLHIHLMQHGFNLSDPGMGARFMSCLVCGNSHGLTWVGKRLRMRPRQASFGMFWKGRN